jgi:hypothetical protein
MKKNTKIISVLSIYFFLLVIDGCVNCSCPDNILAFFDFKKLNQEVNGTSLSEFDQLEINLSFDSISYLAQVENPCWNLGLINTATACSCIAEGENGLKFPLTQINLTSDQTMSGSLPSGSSLESNFYIIELDYQNNQVSKTLLTDFEIATTDWLNWEGARFQLKSITPPEELGVPHIFKIDFTKSNGEIISTQTPPITWN